METRTLTMNAPAAKTFGWLHVNQTETVIPAAGRGIALAAQIPEGVLAGNDGYVRGMRSGCGPEAEAALTEAGITPQTYTVPEGRKGGTMRLTFLCPETDELGSAGALVGVTLKKNSELTLIMDYQTLGTDDTNGMSGAGKTGGTALIVSRFCLEDGAVLRLTQLQRPASGTTLIHDVGAICADGAQLEQVRVILSGDKSYDGACVELQGKESRFRTEIGYRVEGEGLLDMNYEADHIGRHTESKLDFSGVLQDKALKRLRGTIDLRKGAAGSVGSETDDVFMMNDGVHNLSVPVILCGEEDVVGNHGATIGRLSGDTLFYLESRGMDEEQICSMMAEAKLAAVIRKIPEEELVKELLADAEQGDYAETLKEAGR